MSVTETGLKELMAAVDKLPETVTAALKGVAHDTAGRVLDGYRRRLLSQTKARKTAASAHVIEQLDHKRYVVDVPGDPGDWEGLPRAFEYGTRRMSAKPSLRPAGDAEGERYTRDMSAAAVRALTEALR